MPPWQSQKGQADAFLDFLRFQEYIKEQEVGKQRNPPKPKGKGKGKGAARPSTQEIGTGLNLSRPIKHGEPLFAGRTAQEVNTIITQGGGWVGKRQYTRYKGDIRTGIRKDGDLSCPRCKSATCRPWRETCWICGASVPGGGGGKAEEQQHGRKTPGKGVKSSATDDGPSDSCDDGDDFVLPKASAMASVKRRPPSTVATVLASASLKTPSTYAEAAAQKPPTGAPQPAPPPSDGSPSSPTDPDLLTGAALGQVKTLVASLPASVHVRTGLMELLEKHRAAEARQKRQAADAKQDTVDFTGKTYECILAHHESQLANLKKRAAESSAKREADQEVRRKDRERDRAILQRAADMARKELEEFDELAALRAAEWDASEQAKEADLLDQIKRASEEVERARAAVLAAPAPNTKLGHDPTSGAGTGAGNGTGGCVGGISGGSGNRESRIGLGTPSPQQFSPLVAPPKLHPPTDPAALERLQRALAVCWQWQQQAEEWPLTPQMLGLSTHELSQLVGDAIWSRSSLVSDQAAIPRSLRGSILMALSGLEVTAAAEAAASVALRQSLEAHHAAATATATAMETTNDRDRDDDASPPPGKHARIDTDADHAATSDVEM